MDFMTRKAVAAQIAVTSYIAGALRNERGQASTEYAGVIFVVVAIVGVVILAAKSTNIGTALMGKIGEAIGNLGK